MANPPIVVNPAFRRVNWRQRIEREFSPVEDRLKTAYQRIVPQIQDEMDLLAARIDQIYEANNGEVSAQTVRDLKQWGALLAVVAAEMANFAAIGRDAAGDAQGAAILLGATAARDMAVATAGNGGVVILGVWNQPDPAALETLINYVDGAAMRAKFAAFGENAAKNLADLVLAGVANGFNPRRIASLMSGWFNVPYTWAETMARTAQLWSYRSATHAAYRANPDVVEGWLWQAALDLRTCLSCIQQHGTRHPIDEVLNDHHRGRCTPVPIVKGTQWWIDFENGPYWFDQQPVSMQRAIMGESMWRAYQAGAVGWGDFSKPYQNDVYGEMLREASLRELLGNGARKYYGRS
jgi:hypothetical protein